MANQWDHQSYYEILEVSPNSHESEIRIAYHRAKSTYSQDNPTLLSVFTREETVELLKLVEEAYTILRHPNSRKAYDQRLERERGPQVHRHSADYFLLQSVGAPEKRSESFPEFVYEEAPPVGTTRGGTDSPPERGSAQKGRTLLSSYKKDPAIEESIRKEETYSGDFLQKVREYKNLDLDQIAEHTRIGKEYLRALEGENFEKLPAPVFVRGFLVQLARLFGINEKDLCKNYLDRFKAHKK